MKKILIIICIFIIFILMVVGIFVIHPSSNGRKITATIKPTAIASPTQTTATVKPTASFAPGQITALSYNGQNGKDALTLLKDRVPVEQDHSGLVVSIKGVKPAGHEYWAFYVNGKLSPVGPSAYITKNGDKIEWKIEKY